MPSDQQKRALVSNAYPGPDWAEKVAKMSDKQVAAIYIRLLAQNKL